MATKFVVDLCQLNCAFVPIALHFIVKPNPDDCEKIEIVITKNKLFLCRFLAEVTKM
nr:hypothetical protein [Nostoc sp. EkiNYC01]